MREKDLLAEGFIKLKKDPPKQPAAQPWVTISSCCKNERNAWIYIPEHFLSGPLHDPIFIGYYHNAEKNQLAIRRLSMQDGGVRVARLARGTGRISFSHIALRLNLCPHPTKKYSATFDNGLGALVVDLNKAIQEQPAN